MSSTDLPYDRNLLNSAEPQQVTEQGEDGQRRTKQFYDVDLLKDPTEREAAGAPMQPNELGGTSAPASPLQPHVRTKPNLPVEASYEKVPVEDGPPTSRRPWYKSRNGIIAIVVLILVIIGAAVGGAVGATQGKKSGKTVGNSGQAPVATNSISTGTVAAGATNSPGTPAASLPGSPTSLSPSPSPTSGVIASSTGVGASAGPTSDATSGFSFPTPHEPIPVPTSA